MTYPSRMNKSCAQNAATRRRIPRSVLIEMALQQEAIGRRIAQLRKKHRLTQPEAAARVGVSMRAYQGWEAGDVTPRWKNLDKIAAAFDISVDDLMSDNHGPDFLIQSADGSVKFIDVKRALTEAQEAIDNLRRYITALDATLQTADDDGMPPADAFEAAISDGVRSAPDSAPEESEETDPARSTSPEADERGAQWRHGPQ